MAARYWHNENNLPKRIKAKRKTLLILGIVVLGLSYLLYSYSFLIDRFDPKSRIDFIAYKPAGYGTMGIHLVIPNYLQQSFNFGPRDTELGYGVPPIGDVTQKRATDTNVTCGEFPGSCQMRQTKNYQKYAYTKIEGYRLEDFTEEWVHFIKNGTDILIYRSTYTDRPMTLDTWDDFIDSFDVLEKRDMHFYSIDDKHVWSPL